MRYPGRSARFSFRHAVLAAVAVAHVASPGTVDAQSNPKQVLVLYSTRRDAQFSVVGENLLPRTLDAGLARNLDYYSEFIDVARFPDPGYKVAFGDFLRLKYQGVRFDLVIAMQDVAMEFVNGQRETLFRDTPVVFLANSSVTRLRSSTGLVLERNFTATLAFLRQLQPDVRHVFIVTGAAASDKEYENEVRRQLQPTDSVLTLTYLSGLATEALEARVAKLPEHSAVYYVLVTEDGAGRKFHPLEYIDRVAAAANAPTYCWVDSAMDHGILGGSLYRQKDAIDRVGHVALRVLAGEPADSIPIAVLNVNANEVDWRQLRRWRIDEGRVPPGTAVSYRDPTIWEEYKGYVLAGVALLITQTVLIAGLLIHRRRRRRAEQKVRDLGARLLKAQETERSRIARELHDDICQRMSLLTIELESLDQPRRDAWPVTDALTVAREIAKSLHELSHNLHPTRLGMIGLAAALDQLCQEMSRAGVPIAYTHDNVPLQLAPELMLCVFRVVQEALQNAIKHSHAKAISVSLSGGSHGLALTVVDNGVGFDVDGAWGKGVGLVSMVERLEAIGAVLDIRSNYGSGTRLRVSVPPHVVQSTDATRPGRVNPEASTPVIGS